MITVQLDSDGKPVLVELQCFERHRDEYGQCEIVET